MSRLNWYNIFENLIAGGLIASFFGIFLVWLAKKGKRPILRLYIAPNELDESKLKKSNYEFELKFYINNSGKVVGKKIQLLVNFYNLEILKITPNFKRLDEHHKMPSVQYNSREGLIYPVSRRNTYNTYIGEIKFRLKDIKEEIKIEYDIVAENMEFFGGVYTIKIISSE